MDVRAENHEGAFFPNPGGGEELCHPWASGRKGQELTLSFLSLVVWISLVEFKQGISLVIWVFSLVLPGFQGVRQGGKSLVNLGGFP